MGLKTKLREIRSENVKPNEQKFAMTNNTKKLTEKNQKLWKNRNRNENPRQNKIKL